MEECIDIFRSLGFSIFGVSNNDGLSFFSFTGVFLYIIAVLLNVSLSAFSKISMSLNLFFEFLTF